MTADKFGFRVTGDFSRMVYSNHRTELAAVRAEKALNRKWGNEYGGQVDASRARAERLTENGWEPIGDA